MNKVTIKNTRIFKSKNNDKIYNLAVSNKTEKGYDNTYITAFPTKKSELAEDKLIGYHKSIEGYLSAYKGRLTLYIESVTE